MKDRDEAAWVSFSERYDRMLKSRLKQLLGSTISIEDELAEFRVHLVRALDRFETIDQVTFGPWLIKVLENYCKDRRAYLQRPKRSGKTKLVPLDDLGLDANLIAHGDDPEQAAIAEEMRSRVRHAMKKLSRDERVILQLAASEYSGTEMVALLGGGNPDTVKSWLNRARKRLRKKLPEYFPDE